MHQDTPYFPYVRHSINEEDKQAVLEVLSSDFITRGPKTEAFEEAVKEYCGVSYAISLSSGSAALQAACYAAQASKFDRLVTSTNTFIATLTCGALYGARPVLVDVDPKTGNLDLESLQTEFSSTRGKSIYIPVHFAGVAIDMQKMQELIKEPESVIIEDAAHAFGSSYVTGEKVGSCAYSDMTVLSFHPAKNMTTGEGGMVLTNNKQFYEKLLKFRNNGIVKDSQPPENNLGPWWYECQAFTGNFHMSELQGALGLSQLKRLDSFAEMKRNLLECYREEFSDHPHITPSFDPVLSNTAYHLALVSIDFAAVKKERKVVMEELCEKGIGTQVHYIPLYKHPVVKQLIEEKSIHFPKTEHYYAQALSLPLYPDLKEENVRWIAKQVKECLTSF